MASFLAKVPIQSTAGAIPVKNEKGEITMEKVKVARYVTGKRPDYAPDDSSGEEEDLDLGFLKKAAEEARSLPQEISEEAERADRRLQRLKERHMEEEEEEEDIEERRARHRRLHEPEVLDRSSDEEDDRQMEAEESSGEEEELDEEEIERRRIFLREKAKEIAAKEEELMDKEEEKSEEGSEEESSEYEEYSDSEEEETGPRLKPVFVRKKDRITIQEKEKEEQKTALIEREEKRLAEDRRRQTLRLVEEEARKEHESLQKELDPCDAVETDDENDEEEYEAWKIRELKRLKRDREEREQVEKDKTEIDRLRNMTEEERRQELKSNPKTVTNKSVKGRYKFLQKYYHRGAFFMDEEENVFKRDFSAATLEDHFNKTILPKVMQVKNFGRSGRTKYTHLVDQDTTQTDSPWADPLVGGRLTAKAGTSKDGFEKPSVKKRK